MSQYPGDTSNPQRQQRGVTRATSPPPYAIQDNQAAPYVRESSAHEVRQPVTSPTTSGSVFHGPRNASTSAQPAASIASTSHRRTGSQDDYARTNHRERYAAPPMMVIREDVSAQRQDTRASLRPLATTSLHAQTVPLSMSPVGSPGTPPRRSSVEDPLLQLIKYDTVIIVDDSSSMAGPLWSEARDALAGVAEIASKYDTDGIDIYFLNSPLVGNGLRHAADVQRLFDQVQPDGITPTGEKLEELLLVYLWRLEQARERAGDMLPLREIKPVNYLIITDGAPTDDPETVIVAAARRLDAGRFPMTQVGIQFIQIGNDPEASEALRELDDDLAGRYGIRDIVDTTLYSGNQLDASMLTKCLLGGINRRVDRRGI